MKVLIACGGTGGHINPGLAIADIIKSKYPDAEFLFAGTPKGMEAKLVPKAGYKLETIKVAGFQRKISLENIGRNIKAVAYLATSGKRARQIIDGAPTYVDGKGKKPLSVAVEELYNKKVTIVGDEGDDAN